jgi:hypothetical protein
VRVAVEVPARAPIAAAIVDDDLWAAFVAGLSGVGAVAAVRAAMVEWRVRLEDERRPDVNGELLALIAARYQALADVVVPVTAADVEAARERTQLRKVAAAVRGTVDRRGAPRKVTAAQVVEASKGGTVNRARTAAALGVANSTLTVVLEREGVASPWAFRELPVAAIVRAAQRGRVDKATAAKALGVSVQALDRAMRRQEMPSPWDTPTKRQRAMVVELTEDPRLTLTLIAQRAKVSRPWARAILGPKRLAERGWV